MEQTLGDWLIETSARLRRLGVESPSLESRMIACHVLKRDREWVLAHPEAPFPTQLAENLVLRRETGEPLAYILGERHFYGRVFEVQRGVLIPRQETECLVETALDIASSEPRIETCMEVGSGSGCVAISLALESRMGVAALDVSPIAVQVTQRNAEIHRAQIEIILSDRLEGVEGRTFDLIVSNPPYIRSDDVLEPSIFQFEPPEALFAGVDGLDAYRWLAADSWRVTHESSWLAVEIGMGMGSAVDSVFSEQGWYRVRSVSDLLGHERVLVFRRGAARLQ